MIFLIILSMIVFGLGLGLIILIWGICTYEVIISELRYGWGTLYTLYNLRKRGLYKFDDLDCRIDIDDTNVFILLDPISFSTLFLLLTFKGIHKKIKTMRVTKIFKTYSRVESEIIMDKLTRD